MITSTLVGASSRVNLTLHALSARTSRLTVSFSVKSGYPSLISDADIERELRIRRVRDKMRSTSMKVNFKLASVLQGSALIHHFFAADSVISLTTHDYSREVTKGHSILLVLLYYNGNILLFCLPNLYTRITFFEILGTAS